MLFSAFSAQVRSCEGGIIYSQISWLIKNLKWLHSIDRKYHFCSVID